MDPNWWNNALASYDVGREHRAHRENAEAWGDGGQGAYGRVAQAAGARGDLATAAAARRFEDDERQGAYERMQQIAPFARNVLRRTRTIEDPEQARAFLTQPFVMQRFQDWGLSPEQLQAGIAGLTDPDPNVRQQWFENLDAAFQQHENPEWQLMGRTAVAIQPDGQFMVGGTLPENITAGEWRPATPEEMQSLPPGTQWDINVQTGERRLRYRPNAPRTNGYGGQYPDDGYDYEAD